MTRAKSAKANANHRQLGGTPPTSKAIESVKQHPLVKLSGKYNDEPFWDDYLAAIDEYREEVNRLEAAE